MSIISGKGEQPWEECHSYHSSSVTSVIGYTEEELAIIRNNGFWKPIRYSLIGLFWLLWAGFLAGTTVIVVLNNGDATTTMAPTTLALTTTRQN